MSLLRGLLGRRVAMPQSAVYLLRRALTTEQKLEVRRIRQKQKKVFALPCYMSMRRTEYKCPPRSTAIVCDEDPCDGPLPLDLTEYRPSDKALRRYQRTWRECYPVPLPHFRKKRSYPMQARRSRGTLNRPQTACKPDEPEQTGARIKPEQLMDVQRIGPMPCCKLSAPHCRPARNPPSCKLYFPPSCCTKRATKYPSFSECRQHQLQEPIPSCECAKKVSICEMWAYYRRRHRGW